MPAGKRVGTHDMKPKTFKTKVPPGVVDKMPLKLKARESTDLPPGREGFLTWLYNKFPDAYAALESRAPHVLTTGPIGFGGDDAQPGGAQAAATATPAWVQTIQNIALPALQLYQQKKVVDLQLKRAAAGQRPLDIADYMGDASIRTGLDTSTTRTVYIVLAVVAGLFILPRILPRARS